MKWLITGGCGFIGTCLIKRLLEMGQEVRVFDNLLVGSKEQLAQVCDVDRDVELFIENLNDSAAVASSTVCGGVDIIVHLAAMSGVRESVENPRLWFDSNVLGTFNVLEAARINSIKRVVSASSGASVGEVDPPIHEELPMHPVSPYGATKSCMEVYSDAYNQSYGLGTVCLRFSNVYGPYSNHKFSLVAKFIKRVIDGEVFNVYGDGEQTRDFIYTDDLVEAIIVSALTDTVRGETFQLSSAEEHTVNDIIHKLAAILYMDYGLISKQDNVDEKVGDIRTNWADNTKVKEMLGWEPKVSLKDGLLRTVKWFMEKENV